MADPEANVIFGVVTDESMGNAVKVTVIATGFNKAPRARSRPPRWTSRQLREPAAGGAGAARGRRRRLLPQDSDGQGGFGGRGRFLDLDVPAFLRKGGSSGGD